MALCIEEPRINNGMDFKWLDGAIKPPPTEQLQHDLHHITQNCIAIILRNLNVHDVCFAFFLRDVAQTMRYGYPNMFQFR